VVNDGVLKNRSIGWLGGKSFLLVFNLSGPLVLQNSTGLDEVNKSVFILLKEVHEESHVDSQKELDEAHSSSVVFIMMSLLESEMWHKHWFG